MKKLIFILMLAIANFTVAQNGAHSNASRVQRGFVSSDETKLLTLSGTEIVLWDNVINKPIWVKKLADLGLGKEILYDALVSVDPFMKYMLISNKMTYKCLVNLNTFQVSRWNYDIHGFANDGRTVIIEYVFDKKNSNKAYLLNLDTGDKELMADKMARVQVINNGAMVQIIYNGKGAYDYNYDKSKVYIVSSKELTKYDSNTMFIGDTNLKSGDYSVRYSYSEKSITTKDKSGNKIAYFEVQNQSNPADSNMTHMIYLSEKKPQVYFLEQNFKNPSQRISYVCVYDITNGSVVKKIELHDTSDKANLIAKEEIKKQNEIDAEKQRIYNLPQNVEKRRLSMFYGKYLFNFNTKGIYYVVPDMPLYEGDLVKMKALHNEKKQIQEVYEKLTAIENASLYKTVSSPKTCYACGGKGFYESSGQRTIADYEYTTGKKLVETTYNKSGCSNCGGCGLIPN